jgi:hypothetical protein
MQRRSADRQSANLRSGRVSSPAQESEGSQSLYSPGDSSGDEENADDLDDASLDATVEPVITFVHPNWHCGHCSHSSTTHSDVEAHSIRRHEEDRPYRCQTKKHCDWYPNISELRKHMRKGEHDKNSTNVQWADDIWNDPWGTVVSITCILCSEVANDVSFHSSMLIYKAYIAANNTS